MARYTNKGLVKFVKWMAEKNCPYWFACYGHTASEQLYKEKSASNRSQYDKWPKSSFTSQYGQKVADCSGEIKAYFMNPTVNDDGFVEDPARDSVYNSKYDLSANMLEAQAKEKGSISTIPEIEGLIVWKDGHVGVYIGGGYVIEERGHSYGTVKTRLQDRPWVKWLKHPMLEYIKDDPSPSPKDFDTVSILMPILHQGDVCNQVGLLQLLLNDLGFRDDSGSELKIDNHYGQRTFEAVCRMQEKYNLGADGTVGLGTWSTLLSLRFT